MTVTYTITVQRDMGMKAGTGRTVVADLSVTGTPVTLPTGNPLTTANLHALGMRRIDRVNFDGTFLDAVAKTGFPATWHPTTNGFVWFVDDDSDADPLKEMVVAFDNPTTARVEFVGA